MRSASDGIDLDAAVGYRLKEAASAYHAAMERALRPSGLTITQYATLEILAQRPGLSSAELARATFVTRQSMGAVLQALAGEGLIDRADEAPHGRALPVDLTAAGRERLRRASTAVRSVEDHMLAAIDPGQTEPLRRSLDHATRALRDYSPPGDED